MFAAGDRLVLSLWDRAAFEAEVGGAVLDGPGVVPMTLAHNVATPAEVRDVLDLAREAGADVCGAGRAGVGRLHRLLRRPRRLPLGGRVEPRADRAAGGA